MTLSITITRKMLIAALLTALLFIGVSWAVASHDDPFIAHACVNSSSGTIKIVDGASDCSGNDVALTIVTEDGFLDIKDTLEDLETAIADEIAARIAADSALQTALDSEITARMNADTVLQTAITDEATARAAADTALQTAIDAESTARSSADTDLQTQVTTAQNTADGAQTSADSAQTSADNAQASADSAQGIG